ncbi:PHD-finger, partial [Geosmithia morbida]
GGRPVFWRLASMAPPSPRRSSRARTTNPQSHHSSASSGTSGRAERTSRPSNKTSSGTSTPSASLSSEPLDGLDDTLLGRRRKRGGGGSGGGGGGDGAEDDHDKTSHPDVLDMANISGDDIQDEEDEAVRCICGSEEYPGRPAVDGPDAEFFAGLELTEDVTGFFVQCDVCKVWQHGACVGIFSAESSPDEYFCEQCRKDLHRISTDNNGQKYSKYVPLHRQSRATSRATSTAKERTQSPRSGGSKNPRPTSSYASKRRSTMNSRDAAYDDEQLRRAIEASKEEGGDGSTVLRRTKRGRSDSEEYDPFHQPPLRFNQSIEQWSNAYLLFEAETHPASRGSVLPLNPDRPRPSRSIVLPAETRWETKDHTPTTKPRRHKALGNCERGRKRRTMTAPETSSGKKPQIGAESAANIGVAKGGYLVRRVVLRMAADKETSKTDSDPSDETLSEPAKNPPPEKSEEEHPTTMPEQQQQQQQQGQQSAPKQQQQQQQQQQPPPPGTPPTMHTPTMANSHKKTAARSHHKRTKGRNQYTKDRDLENHPVDGAGSPARSMSRDISQNDSGHGNGDGIGIGNASGNGNGNGSGSGGSNGPAATTTTAKSSTTSHGHHELSKHQSKSKAAMAHKMSMLDMRRRVGAIMDFISRTQVDLAAEGAMTSSSSSSNASNPGSGQASPQKGGTPSRQLRGEAGDAEAAAGGTDAGANAGEKDFKDLNCMEMMDVLTRDMVKWQNQYT